MSSRSFPRLTFRVVNIKVGMKKEMNGRLLLKSNISCRSDFLFLLVYLMLLTFMWLMNKVRHFIWKFVVVYFDDILAYNHDEASHVKISLKCFKS